jgi:nucleoside-diphosphate-sugar epimerase
MLGQLAVIAKGGEAVTDVIYNGDAARGIVAALHAQGPTDVLYNIGSGYGITLAEFGEGVRESYPDAAFDIGPGTQYLNPETSGHCILDVARAKEDLGFEVSHTPASMVRAYVEMMGQMGIGPIAS